MLVHCCRGTFDRFKDEAGAWRWKQYVGNLSVGEVMRESDIGRFYKMTVGTAALFLAALCLDGLVIGYQGQSLDGWLF